MEVKSTLKVFNESEIKAVPGVVSGQTIKPLVGGKGYPSERLTVFLASFEPGTYEPLHWHLIEVVYYVISGRAVMKDIEGKTHELRPGSVIYARPGISGSHSWDIKERLQLIGIRASNEPAAMLQFAVDEGTKCSYVEFQQLDWSGAVKFEKSLYTK